MTSIALVCGAFHRKEVEEMKASRGSNEQPKGLRSLEVLEEEFKKTSFRKP